MPLMPTAFTPSSSTMVTRFLLTRPRTISAISMVSSSVTRSPLTKAGSFPTFSTQRLMAFPPPCTMMGLKPTSFKRVTSLITFFCSSSLLMALPPYLTTIIFLLNFWM